MKQKKKAVVLSSGGLDSTTVMAIARREGFEIYSLSFFYSQRHSYELDAAERVATSLGAARHMIIDIDLKKIGGSALTDNRIDVPKSRKPADMTAGIPVTYVPARNTIFLSYALAWAETLAADHIFIGVNALDYSGYPDCRPEYISAFEQMANLATKSGVEGTRIRIVAPLQHLSKAQIIKTGIELGIDYSITHSCYDPLKQGLACGRCDSCLLRKKGFDEAGVSDPTRYGPE